ncbi:MAG TPA: molybdate ABC transporter substrate-binding protein [Methanocella sp.]
MAVLLLAAMIVAGCTSSTPTPTPVPKTDLTVFAAASLSSAFNQTKAQFEIAHPEANVVYSFDSSGNLQTQIEQGASPDVFASAATSNMNTLKNEGLMNNSTVVNFAKNKLALIVPANNPANIGSLADLNKSGLKLVVCGSSVPCGKYTIQMLQALRNTTGFGAGYYNKVVANEVSQEPSATSAVTKIATGEGDVAVVYASDVQEQYQGSVKVIAIPDSLNVIATYPIGVNAGSHKQALAKAFVDFVVSPAGQKILTDNHFLVSA